MKRVAVVFAILLVFLCVIISIGYFRPKTEFENILDDYVEVVAGDLPEDLRLSIYYLDPGILTRAPLSTEDLMRFSLTKRIIVESDELEAHVQLLRKLDPSTIQPIESEPRINARLYYVFETKNDILLEVDVTKNYGTVFVNGIEVVDHPIFEELIVPFLTEDARNTMGIGD